MRSASRNRKAKAPPQSLAEMAYEKIRTRILRGEFGLGESLPRRQLALELGLSIQPVTEALQRLEAEGLVESEPRVGTRVRIPSIEDIRGTVVLRAALESQAARLFVMTATNARREEIRRLASEVDEQWRLAAFATGQERRDLTYRAQELHHQFHLRLAEYAGCDALRKAIELNLTSVWIHHLFLGDLLPPPGFHDRLAEAVVGQDPMAADEAVREHVQHGLDRTMERLSPYLKWDQSRLPQLSARSRGIESSERGSGPKS